MHQNAIEKYLEQLREVKERGNVFKAFSRGTVNAIYEEATVEVATLQLRKILELLAFGFVLVMGEKAIPAYVSFVKYENIKEFFSQLRKLNKDYYLQPVLQKQNEQGEMQWIYPAADEYLTSEDFAILFEHCDRVLEPRRVGALPMSLEQCKTANLRWYNKIVRLLDAHLVHPEDNDVAYLFQMGASDADPTCNQFKLVSDNSPPKAGRDKSSRHSVVTLTDHLRRQLEYLHRSCELYDAGHLDEAVRLAVVIRVLIHDTKNSRSLLRQMRVKEHVQLATSFGWSKKLPANFQPTSVLPVLASSDEGGTSAPFPLPVPPILMAVNEWWEEIVWKQKSTLTRKDIIIGTANKEGGAHVQAAAPEIIKELRQGLSQVISCKINGVEVGTPENHHLILIRQFAHELLNSESLTVLAR
jgi:hypothetical protein